MSVLENFRWGGNLIQIVVVSRRIIGTVLVLWQKFRKIISVLRRIR